MYVCNCRVAKVNDDDDVSNATRNAWAVVLLLLLHVPPTRKYYQPLSLSHTHTLAECRNVLQVRSHTYNLFSIFSIFSISLSLSSSRLQTSQTLPT